MKRIVGYGLAAIIAALALAAAAQKTGGFSIEQVLSAPFPSELRAAPAGNRVAWTFDARGLRNVWVAEGPEFKARQLTHYNADDGQEIGDITWSPDGRTVVYVRGGPKNQAGEIPNPTSDPAGAELAVWAVPTSGGIPRKLAVGTAPTVSPAGDRVAFLRDGQVWVAPLSGTSPAAQFFQARGTLGSLAWSPDGTRLAFASSRGGHSFAGVYDPRSGSVRYLAPTVDRDSQPRWSPDGKRIAFLRVATTGGAPFGLFEADRDLRWSIWVADAQAGEARQVWQAPAKEGGTMALAMGGDILRWAADDRLVFAAELDGWTRLYSLAVSGGEPAPLTPPECEVEDSTLAPDRRSVVFTSNCGDIDRRHLWRVSVVEGPATQLTSGAGLEWSPQVLADGRTLALLASDARRPAAPHVLPAAAGGKPRPIAPEAIPADFPSAQLVEPQQVIFQAADGWKIHGQLFLPATREGRHPAVIFVHGGPVRQMLLGWHNRYYYHNAYGFNQYLASRGYVVLSVNFRSGIGYGRAFRQAPKRGQRGASEYQDVVAAAHFLRERPEVDAARIGIWGGSYGGYLTALALARNSDLFAAGVDLHGVHDWSAFRRSESLPRDSEAVKLARESSPVGAVKIWRSPVLLIHGDDDRNVNFAQTVDLVARLREQKVEFEQIVYPDEVHDFLRHERWLQAYHAASRFFDAHLKKAADRKGAASQ